MEFTTLTDPITGLDFKALKDSAGNLTPIMKFGRTLVLPYDKDTDSYRIPTKAFEYVPTMTLNECAEYLGVSKVRVSRMCKNGTLNSAKIGNMLVIEKASVNAYLDKDD